MINQEYLCMNMENGCFGYGDTPEEAFQNMLIESGVKAHDIEPDSIQFWLSTDLQVVVETKSTIKNSTGE